jgi:hypothetical protein
VERRRVDGIVYGIYTTILRTDSDVVVKGHVQRHGIIGRWVTDVGILRGSNVVSRLGRMGKRRGGREDGGGSTNVGKIILELYGQLDGPLEV